MGSDDKKSDWHQINLRHDEIALYQDMCRVLIKHKMDSDYSEVWKLVDEEIQRKAKIIDLLNQYIVEAKKQYESRYSELFVPHQRHIAKVPRGTEDAGPGAGNKDKFDPFA